MPRRKEKMFLEGRPYHVLNKAVDQKPIFDLAEDCDRFIFQMYATNRGSPAPNLHRIDMKAVAEKILRGEQIPPRFLFQAHEPLVEFFSFVLASDHYHFGLVPLVRNGIPLYMQKLNLAYAKYFNKKHARVGPLFETRFRACRITTPAQLKALVRSMGVHIKEMSQDPAAYPYSTFPDLLSKRKSLFLLSSALSELKKSLGDQFFQITGPQGVERELELHKSILLE